MRIGIKQFSNQLESYKNELIKFWENKLFDYIELFITPETLDFLPLWYGLKNKYDIKFSIHAPHFSQGCNLADKTYFEYNKQIYKQVNNYAETLDAEYTVVHGGMDGSIEEIVRQISVIKPYKMRIENKPYVAPRKPDEMICRGASPDEIKFILDNYDCGFNLDIGHAFCAGVSLNIEQYEILNQFLKLKPQSYHLSDGEFNNRIDIHYHLGKGDYDWNKIFSMLDKNLNWTLETITKNNTEGLKTVKTDIELIKSFA